MVCEASHICWDDLKRKIIIIGDLWISAAKEANIEVFLLILEGGMDPNIANHQDNIILTILYASERDTLYSETGENILLGDTNCNVI